MPVDEIWEDQRDDVFDVVADIDPHSACIEYAFKVGYQAAQEREARLVAYAMALRGDLVEIDTALTEGEYDHVFDVLTRHMRGTLEEDAAADV